MESKIINRIIIIFLCVFISFASYISEGNCTSSKINYIRIAIVKDAKEAVLYTRGNYEIINPIDNKILLEDRVLRKAKVVIAQNGFQIKDKIFPYNKLRLKSDKTITVIFNNKKCKYRGDIEIISEGDKIILINIIDLEKYVKGVLYHEITNRWPMEAMKAQAVAVRTYAIYQMNQNKDRPYDLTNDIYSQVYGGKSAERYRTNIAVNLTRGQIMYYDGEVLPAYFHSNCAGHTENVKNLWNHDLPPLKGVKCEFCKFAPNNYWEKNFQSKQIQEKLIENGYKLDLIKDIKILDRNESGRIKDLQITTRKGRKILISGKKFRDIVGPNLLKSNNYEIFMKGYYFDVLGKGWGHGVGMCQWGAYGMSQQGYKYEEILLHYYPGVEIRTY